MMKKFGIFLLLIAFTIRLGAAFYWDHRVRKSADLSQTVGETAVTGTGEKGNASADGPFFFGDSDSYWQLGRAVANGAPYQHDPARCWKIFRMPGYPILLAPLFWLGGDHPPVFWARLENVFFGTVTVFLTGLAAWCLFRRRSITFLAMAMAAISPELVFQSVCILSEEAFCVVNLILLLILISLVRRVGIDADVSVSPSETPPSLPSMTEIKTYTESDFFAPALILGGVAAVAVYLRPDWLYFLPWTVLWGILYQLTRSRLVRRSAQSTQSDGRKENSPANRATSPSLRSLQRPNYRLLAGILVFGLLFFAFGMSPWWLRNLRLTGRFIPTTLQMGASLYDGLSPEADGSSRMDFVDGFREKEIFHPEGEPTEREFLEVRLDQKMKRAALDWALSHPSETMRLAWVKFVRLWNFWPNEPSFSSLPIRLTVAFGAAPILILALFGTVLTLRRGFVCWLLWIPALYVTALHVIFVSSLRYRGPILPGLIILAAYACVTLWEKSRGHSSGN